MKFLVFLIAIISLWGCSDEDKLLIPYTNDITLNELQLDKFSHVIPEGGFSSGGIHFNTKREADGSYSGFAYSNRSNRSLTFTGTQEAIDTNRFSVYTPRLNQTGVYAVACVRDGNAFFTLEKPAIIEHILVANTTWSYFSMLYGDKTDYIANPGIPSGVKGEWYTYAPGVERKLNEDGDYFKLKIKGYLAEKYIGLVEFYLCCRKGADLKNPNSSYLYGDWVRVDLYSLGSVDKIVFEIDCSYKDMYGNSVIPSYFCLDGIRLKD